MQATETSTTIRGWWRAGGNGPRQGEAAVKEALYRLGKPVSIIDLEGRPAVSNDGSATFGNGAGEEGHPLLAYSPPLRPADLGDPVFKEAHSLTYPFVAGAMANGITSVRMVEAAARAGMLAFFGAAGLTPEEIEGALVALKERIPDLPFGVNLIHSPYDPDLERATADLYLAHGVRQVSASAYLDLTEALVHYRVKGIHRGPDGGVVCPNRVVGKVSRVEVARKFLSPPPRKLLAALVAKGRITEAEASLARSIPVAEDLTAEADSGGHTDNRPALALLPTMVALRDALSARYGYRRPPCVGLGGGIATPESTAAAFAMGAAYVLTGSVNQACVEAGTSEAVRCMLGEACQADIIMAPAADMFEMGVKVQVLKRGTLFPLRAAKLFDLYRNHDRYEAIPPKERETLERDFFRRGFEAEWENTRRFFQARDPRQVERAEKDPRHKMALVFRSYLGRSSGWATAGDPSRKIDYQIWCGPSLGAFNEWVKDSFLEKPENRKVVTVALNLLLGAAVVTRVQWLRQQGVPIPAGAGRFSPLEPDALSRMID